MNLLLKKHPSSTASNLRPCGIKSGVCSAVHAVFCTLALSGTLLFTGNAKAQDAPLITITKSDKVAISLNGISGPDGAVILQLVQKDLQLSGAFTIGAPRTGNFQASGSVSGASLNGSLTDRSGKSILNHAYSGSIRAQAHAFANDIVEAITGGKGIAGTRLAFVANKSGSKEIYTVDVDGANLTQLTKDRAISVSPALSPDGSKLAYTGYQSGYADVYEVDLSSGSRRCIMKFPGTNSGATYSRSGRIAVTLSKDGNPELYVTDSGGGSPRRLTFTPGVESSPTWSPDGSDIIFSSDTGGSPLLYRVSASGGSPSIIRTGQGYNTEPNWSPDGKKIAFNIRSGGGFAVAMLDLASGQVRQLGDGQDPVWGADSRHIACAQGGSLVLIDAQTLQRSTIVSGLGRISEPTWSHGRR
jgi:TolB protein